MHFRTVLLVSILVLPLAFSACRPLEPVVEPPRTQDLPPASSALPFGNPSNAGTADKNNYLIVHRSHALSYNSDKGTLNWAAWWTRKTDLGDSIERPRFEPDPLLPASARPIQYYDYSGSGYDRGHMVPSADRFADADLNRETFLMSNIVPQTGDLNQHPWQDLEIYARSLARKGAQLYSIAGVYGEKERIKGRLAVPESCWKIIVVFPKGAPANITPTTQVIAVDMPNIDDIADSNWKQYRTSVRAIEGKAGIDLFSEVPREIQDRVETRVDK